MIALLIFVFTFAGCAIPDVSEVDLESCLDGCTYELSECLNHTVEHVVTCTPEDAECFAASIVELIDCNETFGECAADCAGDVEDALTP